VPVVLPDPTVLRRAVEYAGRAPSVHNSQPWRWVTGPDGVDLFLDPDPTAPADERDRLLSCGAALHHLLVALAGLGLSARVERLPDPADPAHLAHVRPVDGVPAPGAVRLAATIARRHTDRGRLGSRPVDRAALDVLTRAAAGWGADLHVVGPGAARRRLVELITRSATLQQQDVAYAAGLARWSGPAATDPAGARRTPHSVEHVDASVLAVLSSRTDDRLGALRAGEATSAVLLVATDLGLASTPLSRPLEPARTRAALGREFAGPRLFPQVVLRVGWARPGAADRPSTPRRHP
jgi:nitroreductase